MVAGVKQQRKKNFQFKPKHKDCIVSRLYCGQREQQLKHITFNESGNKAACSHNIAIKVFVYLKHNAPLQDKRS